MERKGAVPKSLIEKGIRKTNREKKDKRKREGTMD
jgi:hypothetical protein